MIFRNGSSERRDSDDHQEVSGGIREEKRNQQELEAEMKKLGESQEKGHERKSIRQACLCQCCRKAKAGENEITCYL